MNEPKRLLLGEASERERALLEAGAREEPPPGAAALFAASLGLPMPGSAPTPSESPLAQPHEKLTTGKSASGKLATGKLVVKWLAFAGAGLMAISSSWLVGKPGPEHRTSRAPSAPAPAQVAEELGGDEAASSPGLSASERAPLPSQTSSIAAEIAQLERVRTLLRANQSASALRELAGYEARHAHGALREEADFMLIEALAQAERRHEAQKRAARFRDAYPRSIHAARVRELMESLDAR
jgi:hypothetical protein